MIAESPLYMVIFSVDITGYSAADCYKLRSWHYRRKPSPGKEVLNNLIKCDASFRNQYTRIRFKVQKMAEALSG